MKSVKLEQLSDRERRVVRNATEVRERAYAPYSHYLVGAAALSATGRIYIGCNVERVTFSQTTHAERNALDSMAAIGERRILALCCVAENGGIPCAECRQVIWEFCGGDKNVKILGANLRGDVVETTIGELYPAPFGPNDLGIKPEDY